MHTLIKNKVTQINRPCEGTCYTEILNKRRRKKYLCQKYISAIMYLINFCLQDETIILPTTWVELMRLIGVTGYDPSAVSDFIKFLETYNVIVCVDSYYNFIPDKPHKGIARKYNFNRRAAISLLKSYTLYEDNMSAKEVYLQWLRDYQKMEAKRFCEIICKIFLYTQSGYSKKYDWHYVVELMCIALNDYIKRKGCYHPDFNWNFGELDKFMIQNRDGKYIMGSEFGVAPGTEQEFYNFINSNRTIRTFLKWAVVKDGFPSDCKCRYKYYTKDQAFNKSTSCDIIINDIVKEQEKREKMLEKELDMVLGW